MTKKQAIDKIHETFKKLKMRYQYDEGKSMFISGVTMDNIVGNVRIYIFVEESHFIVYTVLNSHIEEKYRVKASEYLHRANYGLNNGNFEIDMDDGEVRYKIYVNFADIQLSTDMVMDSIVIPSIMFDQYGKNLLSLTMTKMAPKNLIADAERSKE